MAISSRSEISFLSHSSWSDRNCWFWRLMASFTDGKSLRIRNCFRSDTSFIRDSPARTWSNNTLNLILFCFSRVKPDSYKLIILSVTFHLSLWGCCKSCNTLNNNTNTYNVGCSNVHLIMVLLCLGRPWNLSLILNLWKGNNVRGAHTVDKAATEHKRDEPGFCFTASNSAVEGKLKANFTYNAEWLNSLSLFVAPHIVDNAH